MTTASELARQLGVTAKSVTSAIERGEIKAERIVTKEGGRRIIHDVEGALADFRASRERAAASVKLPKLPPGVDPVKLGESDDGLMPPDGVDLKLAQTIREWWSAQRERARHEREAGKWVKVEQVHRQTFAVTRATRDALLDLPERLAADLAADSDQESIRDRVRRELTRILTDLATSMEKVCADSE